MKRYIRCASQITTDKQEYIFNFITQGNPKFDSIKDQLIPNISFRASKLVTDCDTVYLHLPDELKDYIKWDKPFKKRNQTALQDFARMIYHWSGVSTPAINIWVDMDAQFHYINSIDMVLIAIDHDGYDRTGYWTKYLITANNTNEFTIGYQVSYMSYADRTGYVKKNGTTIMQESIPSDANSSNNAYIAFGLNFGGYDFTAIIDFLSKHNCFQY
jgi:hypothetical protein